MGRCNNRRTQQRAQELQNTPARARFSKHNPAAAAQKKKKKKKSNNDDDNSNRNRNNSSVNDARQQQKKNVVDRIANRVVGQQQQHQHPTAAAHGSSNQGNPFRGVDVSKFDKIELSEESIQLAYRLLTDLNIVEKGQHRERRRGGQALPAAEPSTDFGAHSGTDVSGPGRNGSDEEGQDAGPRRKKNSFMSYSEYDDDVLPCEEDGYRPKHHPPYGYSTTSDLDGDDYCWEGDSTDSRYDHQQQRLQQRHTITTNHDDDGQGQDGGDGVDDDDDDDDHPLLAKDDPVFDYLTRQWSFSTRDAARACRALETWQGAVAAATDAGTNGEGGDGQRSATSASVDWRRRVGLALDWLSLHLSESALKAGLRPRKSKGNDFSSSSSYLHMQQQPRIKTIPVAHPSISVAPKITEDAAYLQRARLEECAVGYVALGFSYADTLQVLEGSRHEQISGEQTPNSLLEQSKEDSAIIQLLLSLERETLQSEDQTILSDNASAECSPDVERIREERELEKEALMAIYDKAFQVVRELQPGIHTSGPGMHAGAEWDRYKISVPINDDADSEEEAVLHIFLRPDYPTSHQPPLFLFYYEHYAAPLLRRINVELVQFSHEHQKAIGGGPCVFEAVSFLNENLLGIRENFQKEVRAQEFKAEQIRLRMEAGHKLDGIEDASEKGGRRQRAKIKGLERAYGREQQLEQEEQERRIRQEERIQRAQEEDRTVRYKSAARALEQREKEHHEEGIRRAYRSAMLASLNRDESVEEARIAADQAKRDYCREHGLPEDNDEKEAGGGDRQGDAGQEATTSNNEDIQNTIPEATPTTAAFMERLRSMYNAAAQQKGQYRLREASAENDRSSQEEIPRPVVVPVGELATIMEDVATVQNEQPWLVSAEARVPFIEGNAEVPVESSLEQGEGQMKISKQLKRDLERRSDLSKVPKSLAKIFEQRQRLPAYQMRQEIVATISKHQVTVVAGDTGCGKTTQTPQLVLDDLIRQNVGSRANIIVTQPRRISAIGVSERISAERGESVGQTCGYSIKLEKRMSKKTRLLLCTTGVLLRRLQCDPDLASVSHVFLDEVHERDLNTDFLLIILKSLLKRRKTLRLVLMSATLNADAFAEFFNGAAIVSIPGRAHPVTELRLEDALQATGYEVQEGSDYAAKQSSRRWSKSALRKRYFGKYDSSVISSLSIADEGIINYELIALLLQHIVQNHDEPGAILVFLPGMGEIQKAIDETRKIELFQSPNFVILPLHSSLPTAEQTAVFEVPPDGVRKIVFSTNIAETSITIEDVVFVIDSGRVKENRRDEIKETPTLVECWVSRASAKQRRGRAGRVRPGIAYHLFSTHTHEEVMEDYQLPEMLRVGLEDLTLQILTLDLGEPSVFLSQALNPPSKLAMTNSLKQLQTLGAVECRWHKEMKHRHDSEKDADDDCSILPVTTELTALGFHLASLPVEPRVGKILVYGSLFGCADPILTIAAAMTSSKSLFVSPFDQRDAAREAQLLFATDGSDHLSMLNAFDKWKSLGKRKGDNLARENFMSRMTLFGMEDLRKHYAELLVDIGFLPTNYRFGRNERDNSSANSNARNTAMLKAVLCAGLYPGVVVAPRSLVDGSSTKEAGELVFRSNGKGDVHLHPCTVSFTSKRLESRYCCFFEIVKTSKMYVRDITPVSPVSLLLFGGALKIFHEAGVITVDEWLKFQISAKSAVLISHLRLQLEKVLLQKILSPEIDVADSKAGKDLIDSVTVLLARERPIPKNQIRIDDGAEIVRPFVMTEAAGRSGRGGGDRSGRGRGRRGGRDGGGGRSGRFPPSKR